MMELPGWHRKAFVMLMVRRLWAPSAEMTKPCSHQFLDTLEWVLIVVTRPCRPKHLTLKHALESLVGMGWRASYVG